MPWLRKEYFVKTSMAAQDLPNEHRRSAPSQLLAEESCYLQNADIPNGKLELSLQLMK